jgi:hypothetical protein
LIRSHPEPLPDAATLPVRNPCTVLAASILCERNACSRFKFRILSVALKLALAPRVASARLTEGERIIFTHEVEPASFLTNFNAKDLRQPRRFPSESSFRDNGGSNPPGSAIESFSVCDLPQTIEIRACAASSALLVAAENAQILDCANSPSIFSAAIRFGATTKVR